MATKKKKKETYVYTLMGHKATLVKDQKFNGTYDEFCAFLADLATFGIAMEVDKIYYPPSAIKHIRWE